MNPRLIYFAVIVASTIWVAIDANKLGMRRGGLHGGVLDMGAVSWTICVFFLWIVSFPCYLVARSRYQSMREFPLNFQGAGLPPLDPRLISPDGRWWWNGQQWIPMPPPNG